MHYVTIVWISAQYVGNDFAERLGEDTLIDILYSSVDIFFRSRDPTKVISLFVHCQCVEWLKDRIQYICDEKEIARNSRHHEEQRIDAVKHPAMSGKYIAAVLYSYSAFEHRFKKIAPGREYRHKAWASRRSSRARIWRQAIRRERRKAVRPRIPPTTSWARCAGRGDVCRCSYRPDMRIRRWPRL